MAEDSRGMHPAVRRLLDEAWAWYDHSAWAEAEDAAARDQMDRMVTEREPRPAEPNDP